MARRIFLLLIVCAVLPIVVLSTVSYFQAKSYLDSYHFERLRKESKDFSTSIYERLLLLQGELSRLTIVLEVLSNAANMQIPDNLLTLSQDLFTDIRIENGSLIESMGNTQIQFLAGKNNSGVKQIMMVTALPGRTERLVGTLNQKYLWAADSRLTEEGNVCILCQNQDFFICTDDSFREPIVRQLTGEGWPHKGVLSWKEKNKSYQAGYTSLFLESNFDAGDWSVVLIESASETFFLRKGFFIVFPAMVIFSLGLVFMIGQYLLRRSMGPIEILQDATKRIAGGDFGHTIDIQSGDEFEDLGGAFNEMSRRLQESKQMLLRTARLSTMGQMASGFVHEVKQPLSAIYGLAQLITLKEKDEENLRMLNTMATAIQNLDTTLNRFSSFSKDKPIEKIPLEVNAVIDEVCRLLSIRFAERSISIQRELDEDLPMITGDRRGLQQVLSNLLVNALDALEGKEKEDLRVVIRTRSQNEQVIMEVSDNGCGMSAGVCKKIFDPFYTTKSPEKGTGIGMAIVEAIVHQHNAEIFLESEIGIGTTFRIVFPAKTGG